MPRAHYLFRFFSLQLRFIRSMAFSRIVNDLHVGLFLRRLKSDFNAHMWVLLANF
jgi:hypothetical protein